MAEPRDLERAREELQAWCDEAGVVGPYEGQVELAARLMAEGRRQSAMLPGAPHAGPEDCPAFYDRCNCDVETLEHNMARAERAEARVKELEVFLRSRVRDMVRDPECGAYQSLVVSGLAELGLPAWEPEGDGRG